MKVRTHRAQGTGTHPHNSRTIPVAQPSSLPTSDQLASYIEGRVDSFIRSGRGAETSDRLARQAWPWPLKSAYAHLLNLPDHVAPADHQVACQIVEQLESIEERGGWTQNEWARLYRKLDQWRARASGHDSKFNLLGWSIRGSGHHTPPVVKAMQQMGKTMKEAK